MEAVVQTTANPEEAKDSSQLAGSHFVIIENGSAFEKTFTTVTLPPKQFTRELYKTLEQLEVTLLDYLEAQLSEHKGLRVYLVIEVEYGHVLNDIDHVRKQHRTQFAPMLPEDQIFSVYLDLKMELLDKEDNFMFNNPGLILKKIKTITVNVAALDPKAWKWGYTHRDATDEDTSSDDEDSLAFSDHSDN
jgi:hypothetical protein